VLTIGALLGMAAHIEGKASMILDMSGLAQKGGAVLSHVRLSEHTADVTCSRIVTGTADLVMAADEVVAAAKDTITLCESSRTVGVINTHVIPTADFILNRDFNFQSRKVNHVLETALRKDSSFFDFTKPAEALLGDSIATNMMMMGYAYQKGLLPLSAKAIEQAIEVNGVAIKMNTQAFQLGRLAAADPARLEAMMKGQDEVVAPKTLDAMSLDEIIAHRSALLTDYQNAARRALSQLVKQVRDAPRPMAAMATRCRARSRSTTPSCSPTRTSTKSRGSSPTAASKSSSATSSKATSSSTSTWRRRCSAAARTRWAGRRSAPSAPG
jgi:indolepyruvate ferredoxin oxidoreductase